VDASLLFSLLCRSLVLICGCAIRDNSSSLVPSSFASSSSQKNMVLTRALREKRSFVVEVAEVRYMRLGLPAAPENPETAKLLGCDSEQQTLEKSNIALTTSSSSSSSYPSPSSSSSSRGQLRPDAMAITVVAAQLHKRNIVRAV
jgi:hypothetical protein